MTKLNFLKLLTILLAVNAYSQEDAIFTDRPGQTDAVPTIGKGYFQIETGYLYSKDEAFGATLNYSTVPNLGIKYGVIDRVEIKIFLDYVATKFDDGFISASESGIGPIALGTKIFLFENKGILPSTSLSAKFSLPNTGKNVYQHNDLNPSFRLNMENPLTETLSLSYSIGGDWGDNSTSQGAYTLVVGNSFSNNFSGWAELFGTFSNDFDDILGFDFGMAYLLTNYLQLDTSFGVGLNDAATDLFFNLGISWKTKLLNK